MNTWADLDQANKDDGHYQAKGGRWSENKWRLYTVYLDRESEFNRISDLFEQGKVDHAILNAASNALVLSMKEWQQADSQCNHQWESKGGMRFINGEPVDDIVQECIICGISEREK